MTDRVTALVRDLEAIPGAYERLAGAGELAQVFGEVLDGSRRRPRSIVLTGLGSSRFAALEIEAMLRSAGVETVVEPASTDTPIEPAVDRLCVAISSSGRTAETVAAAQRHRETGTVLAITRDAGSPLAGAAHATLVLPVAAEESGIATTTYAGTVAALLHLAAALGASDGFMSAAAQILAGAQMARAALASRNAWLPEALEVARSAEAISVIAPWSERGVAEQVALLFREGPRRSADVFETAEWLHVGVYTALPGSVTLLLAGSPADDEVARMIAGRSGQVIAVRGPVADGSWPAAAVVPSPVGPGRFVGPALLAAELWRLHAGG